MYLPSYKLNIIYEVSPPANWSIKSEVPTQTWTVSDLRCAVKVKADNTPTPNTAEIKLWNVSPDSISKMTSLGDVSLSAGYEDESNGIIFRGNILACSTKPESDGVVTTLQCSDGGRAHALGNMQVSYAKNSTSTRIVTDLLNKVVSETGLGAGNVQSVINSQTPKVYRRGFSDSGSSLRILVDFLANMNISLSIQQMALQAVITDHATTQVYELSASTGLIGSPDLASMTDLINATKAGATADQKAKAREISLKAFLLPLVQINSQIHLKSRGREGYYIVNSIEHSFDTHSGQPWTTSLGVS